ncbi:hypothetical protein RUND412_011467, partial [Rhizina undulata]
MVHPIVIAYTLGTASRVLIIAAEHWLVGKHEQTHIQDPGSFVLPPEGSTLSYVNKKQIAL